MTKKCCHNRRAIKAALKDSTNSSGSGLPKPKKASWQIEISQTELRNLLKTEGEKKKSRNKRKQARRDRVLSYKDDEEMENGYF